MLKQRQRQLLLPELLRQHQHRSLVDQLHLPLHPRLQPAPNLNLDLVLSLHQSRDLHHHPLLDHRYLDPRRLKLRYLVRQLPRRYPDLLPRYPLLDQHRPRPLPRPKSPHQSHAQLPESHITNLQLDHLQPPVNPQRNHQDQVSSRRCSLPTQFDRPIPNPQNLLLRTVVYRPMPLSQGTTVHSKV